MKEPTICPYDCGGKLKKLTGRSYYCEKCKIILQISVEITSVESPLLKEDAERE